MCTAVSFKTADHYFGRNLDLHYSYNEQVTITPRNFPFHFSNRDVTLDHHYAIIGMATIINDYPLYYDACNEYGVSMAGLNFPGNAVFKDFMEEKDNISPFEFIPWILSQCKNLDEVRRLLDSINLLNVPFSEDLPLSPLHYLISHEDKSVTVESVKDGLMVYDNPVGVLTNNPIFPYHLLRLSDFIQVTRNPPINRFTPNIDLIPYSLGMGSIGLPGDLSSSSRFVRVTFTKFNSDSGSSESESVSQFFHILQSVFQPKGCTALDDGTYEYTIYSSCMNTDKGIYYYKTYNNAQINAVDLYAENLNGSEVLSYPLIYDQNINVQNTK